MLAGAAGVAALSVVSAPKAAAVDGAPVLQGLDNTATTTTALRIDEPGGGPDAALELGNDNGPTLRLQALGEDWEGALDMGEIANTTFGPLIGVEDFNNGLATGYLATNFDLAAIPVAYAISPSRVLDTRTAGGRSGIVRSSAGALDADGRLHAGGWIDVAIDPANENFTLQSIFVNLTAVAPRAAGFLSVYAPGSRPNTSTLNVNAGQTQANGAFVEVGIFESSFVVRLYSNTTTHVALDLTGVTITDVPGPVSSAAAGKKSAQARRTRVARRPVRVLGRGRR
jgi:hypothetical protein